MAFVPFWEFTRGFLEKIMFSWALKDESDIISLGRRLGWVFQIEGITPAGALGGSTGRKLKGFYKGMKGKGEVGC